MARGRINKILDQTGECLVPGMATGALVGLLLSVVIQIPLGDNPKTALVMSHMSTALLTLVGIPLASAFSIRFGAKKLKLYEPRLLQLIPVAFLTLFIPVFGALMGTPNKINVPLITLLGAAGGAFWSMPFVGMCRTSSAKTARKTGERLKIEDALIDAALEGNIEAVKQHLAAGADVNAKNNYGNTPLDVAIKRKRTETADLLRKHGGKTGEELKAEGK